MSEHSRTQQPNRRVAPRQARNVHVSCNVQGAAPRACMDMSWDVSSRMGGESGRAEREGLSIPPPSETLKSELSERVPRKPTDITKTLRIAGWSASARAVTRIGSVC